MSKLKNSLQAMSKKLRKIAQADSFMMDRIFTIFDDGDQTHYMVRNDSKEQALEDIYQAVPHLRQQWGDSAKGGDSAKLLEDNNWSIESNLQQSAWDRVLTEQGEDAAEILGDWTQALNNGEVVVVDQDALCSGTEYYKIISLGR